MTEKRSVPAPRRKRPVPTQRRNPASERQQPLADDGLTEFLDFIIIREEVERETKEGRRFIRWRFDQVLERDLTPNFMAKLRKRVTTAFYLRYIYSYQIRNMENGTIIDYYKNSVGSPWINRLSEAESWLSEKEKNRLEPDNIARPNTKWEFVGFFNVDVKAVLERQPLLGTGPLPDWLRNLPCGRAGPIVALDTFQDNLCLWRCIAAHCGAIPHRSTQSARLLAESFFKLGAAPSNWRKTSLDELDKVERHLNQGKTVSDWLGMRVYEPEREADGEVIWHLRRNPSDRQAEEHTDNRSLRGARVRHQGYCDACKNVCMRALPSSLHTSLSPSTPCQKVPLH